MSHAVWMQLECRFGDRKMGGREGGRLSRLGTALGPLAIEERERERAERERERGGASCMQLVT